MNPLERALKVLYIKIFKPDFAILDCKDITSEYEDVREGERIFRVEYYKNGKWYIKRIRFFIDKYSDDKELLKRIRFIDKYPDGKELRALQEYCVKRVKHV